VSELINSFQRQRERQKEEGVEEERWRGLMWQGGRDRGGR